MSNRKEVIFGSTVFKFPLSNPPS